MNNVYVNKIIQEGDVTTSYAVHADTLKKDLKIVLNDLDYTAFTTFLYHNSDNPFHLFKSYCQLLVHIKYNPEIGAVIIFTEFKPGDADVNFYNSLVKEDWTEDTKQEIIEAFQEIQGNRQDLARLVLENPVQ